MGFLEEKEEAWKKAEERAKAMKEKEKAIFEAAKGFKGKEEPDEIYEHSKKMHQAYRDYADEESKPGFISKVLKWLGF
jgi:hypothetical protein